jgi:hypothetical protein
MAQIAMLAPKTGRVRARLGRSALPAVVDSRGRRHVRDYVDVHGASGVTYRFLRLKDGRPLSPMGGNFLYGRFTGEAFELVLAGEAQNLLKDARDLWGQAVDRYQVSELYSRLNISERVRLLELADIVEANRPPMNREAAAAEAAEAEPRRLRRSG